VYFQPVLETIQNAALNLCSREKHTNSPAWKKLVRRTLSSLRMA